MLGCAFGTGTFSYGARSGNIIAIEVFDARGQVIYKYKFDAKKIQMDISEQPNGIDIVKLTNS